jgi:xanthine dehydrogenase accessory factor
MDVYDEIARLRREGRRCALATIINVRGSIPSVAAAKMLVRDDGSIVGTIGGGCVEAEVWQGAREVMKEEKPRTLTFNLDQTPDKDTGLVCGGTLQIFVEPVLPPAVVYIFGAGHVGLNVYKIARLAGFEVIVVDDRDTYANQERCPEAREVHADDMDRVMAQLTPTESAFIVIVTRGHRHDMRVLGWAIKTPAHYIGMIGSRRKVLTVCEELQKQGASLEKLKCAHAPIGLDIGATTPEEIAVSIVAEMIADRRHSTAALPHLRCMDTLFTEEVDPQLAKQ